MGLSITGNTVTRLRDPCRAIQYVGFGDEQGDLSSLKTRGAYLSARYESRREVDDYNVLNYLLGRIELNLAEDAEGMRGDEKNLEQVVRNLQLSELVDMPVSNLTERLDRQRSQERYLESRKFCCWMSHSWD